MNSLKPAVMVLLIWTFAVLRDDPAAGATDPLVNVSFLHTNQNIILSWAGATAVPYQVEASSNLITWSAISPVLTGDGSTLSLTNSLASQTRRFYRVTRLFPAPQGSAVFNPATGLLTIVGDDFDNIINVSRDSAGLILVNNGATPITGGVANVTNTVLIQVLGLGGNDQISIANGLPPAHLFGDTGNDTLLGGSSADVLVGGPGNDYLDGNQGNDLIFPGEGDDIVNWDPGDGNDFIHDEGGNDTLVFNASNVSEKVELFANGTFLRLTRDVANITIDADGIEQVTLRMLGGADTVTLNNLVGTTVTQVNVDLAASGGGGDGQADNVVINGTPASDTFDIAANTTAVEVTGLGALVRVLNAELANDRIVVNGVGNDVVNVNGTSGTDTMQVLPSPITNCVRTIVSGFTIPVDVTGSLSLSVNGLGGDDTITAANGLAILGIPLTLDGGDGDDTISGGDVGEVIIGGNGNDVVSGGRGNDLVFLGDGNDTFTWNPGDGSDTIEGQTGSDTLVFNCSNVSEKIRLSPNGSRLLLTRDVASIVMDVNGVETVNLPMLGGADTITIDSLDGTSVTQVNVDLGASGGGGDGAADMLTINGTALPDTINITANSGAVDVSGLAAAVHITHSESANDILTVNGLGGTDSISVGPDVTSLIGVVTNQ